MLLSAGSRSRSPRLPALCGRLTALLSLLLTCLAPAKAQGLPSAPADLDTRLQPIVDLVKAAFAPHPTRVLSVRGDTVFLEPVPGVSVGDDYWVFAPGTVVAGSDRAEALPRALAKLDVAAIESDHLTATFLTAPIALPTFAPATRPVRARSLTQQWFFDEPALQIMAEHWEIAEHLTALISERIPDAVTAEVEPPGNHDPREASSGIQGAPEPTDLLTVYVGTAGLRVELTNQGEQLGGGPFLVEVPLFGQPLTQLYVPKPGTPIASIGDGTVARYPLPEQTCDCTWHPTATSPPELWCLSVSGVTTFTLDGGSLRVKQTFTIPWEATGPYSRTPAGRLRFHDINGALELWPHWAHGGTGQRIYFKERGVSQTTGITRIALPTSSPEIKLFASSMVSDSARYFLGESLIRVDGTERTPKAAGAVRDAAALSDHLVAIDKSGQLQLLNFNGEFVKALDAGRYNVLNLQGARLFADIEGSRTLLRAEYDPAQQTLVNKQALGPIPGALRAIAGQPPGSAYNSPVWAVVDDDEGRSLLVTVNSTVNTKRPADHWPTQGGPARIGFPTTFLNLTPEGVFTPTERQCFSALYDTPLRLLPDGATQSQAAIRVAHNEDHSTWELTLHPALRWTDGQPVTAAQVIAGWQQTISAHPLRAPAFHLVEGYAAMSNGRAASLAGLTALSADTIRISLVRGDPHFDTYLADPTWALVKGNPTQFGSSSLGARTRIGTGPFRASGFTGHSLTLVRNDNHIGGIPWLSGWEWQLLGSPQAVTRAYLAGRLDVAPVAASAWNTFRNQTEWHVHTAERASTATLGLVINPRSSILGRSPGARAAFLAAPNYQTLRNITLGGTLDRAQGHFSDRLGLKAPAIPAGSGRATPSELILVVPAEQRGLMVAAERIVTELKAQNAGWRIRIVTYKQRELLNPLLPWDVALWVQPGPLQPALAEGAEFAALWDNWGKGADPMQTPWSLEADLIRQNYWRPLGHPKALWLRRPTLHDSITQSGWIPDWANANWERRN